ncbi:MAG: molybdopterin-containing oxidoreductase family protein [Moraxellaceae bacterium]
MTHAWPAPDRGPTQRKTFCGICESSCGLVVTTQNGQVLGIRPDESHPSSKGFACSKGVQFDAVINDPDRVLQPLRRVGENRFEPTSWDEALADIGQRMRAIQNKFGNSGIGVAWGNPTAWNLSGASAIQGMAVALKTRHNYTTASLDVNNYYAASHMLYGHPGVNPLPEFDKTDFALIVGANPFVSHGSLVTIGNIRQVLMDIPARGGRVIVVDPRRSETAAAFEHVAIRPGSDQWLLGAMLKLILDEGWHSHAAIKQQTRGIAELHTMLSSMTLARAETETGIAQTQIRAMAEALTKAKSACVYGRCGASLGRFSTLTKFLLDALAIVTGNLDQRGGMVFGDPLIDKELGTFWAGMSGIGRWHTRVEKVPETMGAAPFSCLPKEITTPGKGQLRSLLICSANPAISAPGNQEMEAALEQLELLVCIDPYITDTSRLAHWILPPTLWLEREQFPVYTEQHAIVPNAQWVAPVVPPRGEARDDAWIIDQICRHLGIVPSLLPGSQLLGKAGIRLSPLFIADLSVRLSRHGDWFGLHPWKLNRRKLLAHEGAIQTAAACPVGVLDHKLWHKDKRVHMAHPQIRTEINRLMKASEEWAEFPLRLFSIREYRSHNSWLYNVPKLMSSNRRCRIKLHPSDASAAGILDRTEVRVRSPWGEVCVPLEVSEEIMPGTVGMPQGWGHKGGWHTAVAAGGASYNQLTPTSAHLIDRPSGNAWLNGIPVSIEKLSLAEAGK